MTDTTILANALHAGFPGENMLSQAEFEQFCQQNQELLKRRFLHEQRLVPEVGSDGPAVILREGTCAPCLRVANYTTAAPAGGEPNWREAQQCDCTDRLGNRARAALHFLESVVGLADWSRVLLFGPPDVLDRRLAHGRPGFARQARLVANGSSFRLDSASAAFHAVVCWDQLHKVPPLAVALNEIRRVLAPGGSFVFTIPFRYRSAKTLSYLDRVRLADGSLPAEAEAEVHEIGWDILEMLRHAGFSRSLAHHYWSEELGYLGPFNMLFSASV